MIRPEGVILSVGDDAAVFRAHPPGGSAPHSVTLLTTDMLCEGVHFLRNRIPPLDLGYKCLAVNLSDMAAMGAHPREAFVSLALPPDLPVDYLEALYQGMDELARRFEVNILGGDTTSSLRDLIINIALTGTAGESEILRRDKARIGDRIFLTGICGESRAGLELLLSGANDNAYPSLRAAHVRPRPQIAEGQFLAASGVRCALDVSDGLSSDLRHIARASGVGIRIDGAALPASPELTQYCRETEKDLTSFQLAGGEDYCLCGAVSPGLAEKTKRRFADRFGYPLAFIGEVTAEPGIVLRLTKDDFIPLPSTGWDHFSSNSHG